MCAFGIPDWWYGDLHQAMSAPVCSVVLVLCSVLCGAMIGMEREHRDKPAGVKTVTLICIGSTIFTITSILIAGDSVADRGRIAAQVVTGVGFLGAGAIIRERGAVIGLTTGATIWVVAAIGTLIGTGYAAGGFAMTAFVLVVLVALRRGESYLHRWAGRTRHPESQNDEEEDDS